ncbi:hypothetical protein ACHWQZ_G012567 [Mnemiopsis leidyi]
MATTQLEIKTDSEIGSGDTVMLFFYTSNSAGRVYLYFTSTPQYYIKYCTSRTDFPADLPADVNKIWRIGITRTLGIRLQIHCNDVEVLNILISDTTCSDGDWTRYWNEDIEKIYFNSGDTASDYYKLSDQENWVAVKQDFDLETTPLEIKTDSVLGSGDQMYMYFCTSEGVRAGGIGLLFTSTPQYYLYYCSLKTNFPTDLPVARDKVWRIGITRTSGIRLQIHCNDVEVLNILMSDTTCSNKKWSWIKYWTRVKNKIYFTSEDTASDYYRAYQGQGKD